MKTLLLLAIFLINFATFAFSAPPSYSFLKPSLSIHKNADSNGNALNPLGITCEGFEVGVEMNYGTCPDGSQFVASITHHYATGISWSYMFIVFIMEDCTTTSYPSYGDNPCKPLSVL